VSEAPTIIESLKLLALQKLKYAAKIKIKTSLQKDINSI
jgi:hypothetical protein